MKLGVLFQKLSTQRLEKRICNYLSSKRFKAPTSVFLSYILYASSQGYQYLSCKSTANAIAITRTAIHSLCKIFIDLFWQCSVRVSRPKQIKDCQKFYLYAGQN